MCKICLIYLTPLYSLSFIFKIWYSSFADLQQVGSLDFCFKFQKKRKYENSEQRATLHKADEEGRFHTCMIWSRLSSLCTAQDHQRWLCSNRPTESCLAGRSAPIRIKDRQYYKKLLDRYFGHNHALANESLGKAEKKLLRQTAQTQMKMNGYQGNMFCPLRDDRQFPHVRLSYSTSDRKVVLSHQTSRPDDSEAEELFDLEVGKSVPCCWVVVFCLWVANFWHGFFSVHFSVVPPFEFVTYVFVGWCDCLI